MFKAFTLAFSLQLSQMNYLLGCLHKSSSDSRAMFLVSHSHHHLRNRTAACHHKWLTTGFSTRHD